MASQNMMKVQVKTIETSDPTLPLLVLQITQLVDTYMLWIGTAGNLADTGNGEKAVLEGHLCKDWACAMPPRVPGAPSAATPLFRSSSSDVALSMAQRLAKRVQKQIFLSVDLPLSPGEGHYLVLEAEKAIVGALKEVEKGGGNSKRRV